VQILLVGINLSRNVRLHFQGFPGLGYGRRVFLQAVLTSAQNAIPEIYVHVHFLEIYAERFPVHFGQAIPERQQPVVCKVPIAQREILEDAKAVRYLLLNSDHTVNKSVKSDVIYFFPEGSSVYRCHYNILTRTIKNYRFWRTLIIILLYY